MGLQPRGLGLKLQFKEVTSLFVTSLVAAWVLSASAALVPGWYTSPNSMILQPSELQLSSLKGRLPATCLSQGHGPSTVA